MIRDDRSSDGVSYWPSVSDLFMTLFIIAVAILGSVVFVLMPQPVTDKDSVIAELSSELQRARIEVARLDKIVSRIRKDLGEYKRALEGCKAEKQKTGEGLNEEISKLESAVADLESRTQSWERDNNRLNKDLAQCQRQRERFLSDIPRHDKPPIITIRSDKGHFFASGSAAVSPDFGGSLRTGGFREIAREILERNRDGNLNVDTLEVIGHTDGIPMKGRGNLDERLPSVLSGEGDPGSLSAGSNNDLGLLRALAIKREWRRFVESHPERETLERVEVRTYSAGQTLPVDGGSFRQQDPRARRIDLRLTKLGSD